MKLLAFTLILSVVLFSIRAGVAMHDVGTNIKAAHAARLTQ